MPEASIGSIRMAENLVMMLVKNLAAFADRRVEEIQTRDGHHRPRVSRTGIIPTDCHHCADDQEIGVSFKEGKTQ